jgi:uncharacterized protein (TIGR00290 family)
MKERVVISWSGGKDSCMALETVLAGGRYDVAALLTTLTRETDCISMHGVRRTLLERQAESLGFPLEPVIISKGASNQEYESALEKALTAYLEAGVGSVVFGDLFLEDIRDYREKLFSRLGMQPLFPLWQRDSSVLITDFLERGFKAVVTCVNSQSLDSSFAGRVLDRQFLSQLPSGVDPCGENGEFHSFVFGGPLFKQQVTFSHGEVTLENEHYYCDLIPSNEPGVLPGRNRSL